MSHGEEQWEEVWAPINKSKIKIMIVDKDQILLTTNILDFEKVDELFYLRDLSCKQMEAPQKKFGAT